MASRMLMASAASGVYCDESGLELELALSIGTGKAPGGGSWEHFVSMASSEVSSSSSATHAPSHCIQRSISREIVGWPPVRTQRTNNTLLNISNSYFVKVTMDGISIGRKMDLKAHNSYNTLLHSVNQMFPISSSAGVGLMEGGSESEFVLTYKDRDGDWMLVGDVPWDMFVNSARRLRIMTRAAAIGLEQ